MLNFKNVVLTVARMALGIALVMGSVPKIEYPYSFLAIIYGYELVTDKTALIVAMSLPWLEFVTGFCLVIGVIPRPALAISSLLFLMFIVAMSTAMHRHLTVACGCFDVHSDNTITFTTIMKTVVALFATLMLLFFDNDKSHGANATPIC